MENRFITCQIELMEHIDNPTKLYKIDEFLCMTTNTPPKYVELYNFCDVLIKNQGVVIGQLTSGNISDHFLLFYLTRFNNSKVMEIMNDIVEINLMVPVSHLELTPNDYDKLVDIFNKSSEYQNIDKDTITDSDIENVFNLWMGGDGKNELLKFSRPLLDENGKLIYYN